LERAEFDFGIMFSTLSCVWRSTHGEPSGEPDDAALRLDFDRRPDAGLLACRELDDASSLTASTAWRLAEARTGKNSRHGLVGLQRATRT